MGEAPVGGGVSLHPAPNVGRKKKANSTHGSNVMERKWFLLATGTTLNCGVPSQSYGDLSSRDTPYPTSSSIFSRIFFVQVDVDDGLRAPAEVLHGA